MAIVRATTVVFAGIAVIAAACSSVSEPTTAIGAAPPGTTTAILNQGGTSEGHTPTDFPGTGPGLFVGDNLNASFPDGVGVQTYLEFALPADIDAATAVLRSDKLMTSGTPFEDLGALVAEAVVYDTFGPDLFDLTAAGPSVAWAQRWSAMWVPPSSPPKPPARRRCSSDCASNGPETTMERKTWQCSIGRTAIRTKRDCSRWLSEGSYQRPFNTSPTGSSTFAAATTWSGTSGTPVADVSKSPAVGSRKRLGRAYEWAPLVEYLWW